MAGYMPAPGINENDLTYVEKGDYASQAIPKDAFVEWNGKVRTAKAAILQGAELTASLFDDVNSGGALNQISDHLAQSTTLHPITLESVNASFSGTKHFDEMNGIVYISCAFYSNANVCAAGTQYSFATLPIEYRPTDMIIIQGFTVDADNLTPGIADMTISTDGTIKIRTRNVKSNSALYWRFCASFVISHS